MPWGTSSRRCSSAFFADQLGADQPFGLIGHRVGREVLRAFGQIAHQQRPELRKPVPCARAHGHDVVIPRVRKALHQRKQAFSGHEVDLVEHQRLFHLLAAHLRGDGAVLPAHGGCVHHDQQRVNAAERVVHGLDHVFAQAAVRGVQARRVQKHDLAVFVRAYAHDAVARGLGAVGYNGDLLADHGVHQRAFAHVGPAHDGHKSRMKGWHESSSFRISGGSRSGAGTALRPSRTPPAPAPACQSGRSLGPKPWGSKAGKVVSSTSPPPRVSVRQVLGPEAVGEQGRQSGFVHLALAPGDQHPQPRRELVERLAACAAGVGRGAV